MANDLSLSHVQIPPHVRLHGDEHVGFLQQRGAFLSVR